MKRKVAIYARVSTEHEAQLSALDNQVQYYDDIDEKIIEEFVEKVIVHKDYFEWKLNFMNETIKLEVDEKSRKDGFLVEHN